MKMYFILEKNRGFSGTKVYLCSSYNPFIAY